MYSISRGAHFSHAYIDTDAHIPSACTDLYSLTSQPQGLRSLCTLSTAPVVLYLFLSWVKQIKENQKREGRLLSGSSVFNFVISLCACDAKAVSRCLMLYTFHAHVSSPLLVSVKDYLGQTIEELTNLWLFLSTTLTDSLCRKRGLRKGIKKYLFFL